MPSLLRPMVPEDIPQVLEIEREAFPEIWPPTNFHRELQSRLAACIVALETKPEGEPEASHEEDNPTGQKRWVSNLKRILLWGKPDGVRGLPILGYLSLWFMVDEAHITSIAVRKDYRRSGIGELLLIGAVELSQLRNARLVTLEVRLSNHSAQALYEKYGFSKVGIRKGYYTDNHEDAIIMTTENIASAGYQASFQRLKRRHSEKWGESILSLG